MDALNFNVLATLAALGAVILSGPIIVGLLAARGGNL
jgi:hypothetical protein